MVCTVTIGGRRHSGVVLDVSARGLFIQTNAKPTADEPVMVEMSVPNQKETLRLNARVRRVKVVPPQLLTVAQGGLGLEVENAPEAFYALLAGVQREKSSGSGAESSKSSKTAAKPRASKKKGASASPKQPRKAPAGRPKPAARSPERVAAPPPKPGPPKPKPARFRVRASQLTGSRSQSLIVSAASEQEAREQVLSELGEGWKILEVSPG